MFIREEIYTVLLLHDIFSIYNQFIHREQYYMVSEASQCYINFSKAKLISGDKESESKGRESSK